MAIETDILEIKETVARIEELLRKMAGIRDIPSEEEDSEYDKSSAADYCGISRATLDRYAKEIGFPEHRHKGKINVYYLKSELDAIIRIKRLGNKRKH